MIFIILIFQYFYFDSNITWLGLLRLFTNTMLPSFMAFANESSRQHVIEKSDDIVLALTVRLKMIWCARFSLFWALNTRHMIYRHHAVLPSRLYLPFYSDFLLLIHGFSDCWVAS